VLDDERHMIAIIQEFLTEHPEEMVWLDMWQAPGSTKPGPWLPSESCKRFLRWMVEKGWGDPDLTTELMESMDRWESERQAHQAGICNPETCSYGH
jgi:hypothetical protein